jgi:putative acetyltransferase
MARTPSPIAGVRLRARTDADLANLAELWVTSWQETMQKIDFLARRPWFLDHLLGFVTFDPATAYLDQLAVAPEAKGSGAASLLLNEARRLSPDGLTLDVNQDNPRALRFYEREGFEKIGEGTNPRSGLKTWRLRLPKHSCNP